MGRRPRITDEEIDALWNVRNVRKEDKEEEKAQDILVKKVKTDFQKYRHDI